MIIESRCGARKLLFEARGAANALPLTSRLKLNGFSIDAPAIRQMARAELLGFVEEHLLRVTEEQARAILENRNCTGELCQLIAQNPRLASFYSVRIRLVAHRATPMTYALKLVHYLYWPDLLRLSVDVRVPAAIRHSLDRQLLLRLQKLTLGERITAARRCSRELVKVLLNDVDVRVFAGVLINPRVREEDLVLFASSSEAGSERLRLLAVNRKWSPRYAIRKALVMNPLTPRAVAASQLRYLSRADRETIYDRDETSVYLRKCIEALRGEEAAGIE